VDLGMNRRQQEHPQVPFDKLRAGSSTPRLTMRLSVASLKMTVFYCSLFEGTDNDNGGAVA
jgi:hypothetical protein